METSAQTTIVYKRILLKLSGELFGGSDNKGIDFPSVEKVASEVHALRISTGVEIAVVVGAGNLFRGRNVEGTNFDHATADYIGMLGTVMNALALQEEIERLGTQTRVQSALGVSTICEPFVRRRAIRHLEKGRIVILAGGTGSPFFTTDSAAALKASELKCEILLKASNVDGVYDDDPKKNGNAKMYNEISYQEALEKGLHVMDNTAFALCQNEKIPIVVFNAKNLSDIGRILKGEKVGTLVH